MPDSWQQKEWGKQPSFFPDLREVVSNERYRTCDSYRA